MFDTEVSNIFRPISMMTDDMSFYNSLSKILTGITEGGQAIRLAIIQRIQSNQDEASVTVKKFQDSLINVITNLIEPSLPLPSIISLCALSTRSNICILEFDNEVLKSTHHYSNGNKSKREVFIGMATTHTGIFYFPMVIRSDIKNKQKLLSNLFKKYSTTTKVPSEMCGIEKVGKSDFIQTTCKTQHPERDDVCYNDSIESDERKIPLSGHVKKLFVRCLTCASEVPHNCDALNESYHNYLLFKEQLSSANYGDFTSADIVERYGMSTALCRKELDLPTELARQYFAFQMKADGNCGFNSLSFCMMLSTAYGKVLRRCSYLELRYNTIVQNKLKFLSEIENRDMLERMTTDNEFINECILQVLTTVLSRDIIVFAKTHSGNVVKTWYKNEQSKIHLAPLCVYLEGSHYVPLIKLDSSISDPCVDITNILPELRPAAFSKLKKDDLLENIYQNRKFTQHDIVEVEFDSCESTSSTDIEVLSEDDMKVNNDQPLTSTMVFSVDGPSMSPKNEQKHPDIYHSFESLSAKNYDTTLNPNSNAGTNDNMEDDNMEDDNMEDDNLSLLSVDSSGFFTPPEIRDDYVHNTYNSTQAGSIDFDYRDNNFSDQLFKSSTQFACNKESSGTPPGSKNCEPDDRNRMSPPTSKPMDIKKPEINVQNLSKQEQKSDSVTHVPNVKNHLSELRKVKGRFKRDNMKVFDTVLTHLQLRFSTIRLKSVEVQHFIDQLVSSTAPWMSTIETAGMNKKSAKPLLLKMATKSCQEQFCEMLQKANVTNSDITYFREKVNMKHNMSKTKIRDKSRSPVRKVKSQSNYAISTTVESSDDDNVIPFGRKVRVNFGDGGSPQPLSSFTTRAEIISTEQSYHKKREALEIPSQHAREATVEKSEMEGAHLDTSASGSVVSNNNNSSSHSGFSPGKYSEVSNKSTYIQQENDGSSTSSVGKPNKRDTTSKATYCNTEETICGLGKDTLKGLYKLSDEDFNYKPPNKFVLKIDDDDLKKCFDFDSGQFIKGSWPQIIDKSMASVQKVCSFRASGCPTYNTRTDNVFCRMRGKCGGECDLKFVITVRKKPSRGRPIECLVRSSGKFNLVQEKCTGRPIRGFLRKDLRNVLKNRKAKALFIDNFNELKGLRALHRNLRQMSEDVLRKIKSESNTKKRLHKDPDKEIVLLRQKFRDECNGTVLKGFIHDINNVEGERKVEFYNQNSLSFHGEFLKSGKVTVYFDASGGIIRKTSQKTPLLYVLMAKAENGISYPIGEQLGEKGTNIDLIPFLEHLKQNLKLIHRTLTTPFAHMVVVDWSYALINAVCKGFNVQKIDDYLTMSWDLLNGKDNAWKKDRSCIFICTNHLIKACERLIGEKLSKRREHKEVLFLSLECIARLQESFNLDEFNKISRTMIRTFGMITRVPERLEEDIAVLTSRKSEVEIHIKNEPNPQPVVDFEVDETQVLLRKKSPFFQHYMKLKALELLEDEGKYGVEINNKYYYPEILKVIEDHKIAMWPFWSSAVPRATYFPDFIRESSAVVESSFNLRKNIYRENKNVLHTDYAQEAYKFHEGTLKIASDKAIQIGVKLKKNKAKKSTPVDERSEAWCRKTPKSRIPKHFSVKSTNKYTSPRSTPSSFLSRKRLQKRMAKKSDKLDKEAKENISPPSKTANPFMTLHNKSKVNPDCSLGKGRNLVSEKNPKKAQNIMQPTTNTTFPQRLRNQGLPNIGNTCFFNAIMQSFLSLPVLRIRDLPIPFKQVHDLIFEDQKIHKSVPQATLEAFTNFNVMMNNTMRLGQQEDCHSVISTFFGLQESKSLHKYLHIGSIQTVKCLNCKAENTRQEHTLQMSIKPNISVQDGVSAASNFHEEREYNCKKCGDDRSLFSTFVVDHPLVLMLFTGLFDELGNDKPKYDIGYEPYVDTLKMPESFGDEGVPYKLSSFITHAGNERLSGHYKAYVRHQNGWLCCNDSVVKVISKPVLQDDEHVYVQFFTREHVN